jgi:hypothetical protein
MRMFFCVLTTHDDLPPPQHNTTHPTTKQNKHQQLALQPRNGPARIGGLPLLLRRPFSLAPAPLPAAGRGVSCLGWWGWGWGGQCGGGACGPQAGGPRHVRALVWFGLVCCVCVVCVCVCVCVCVSVCVCWLGRSSLCSTHAVGLSSLHIMTPPYNPPPIYTYPPIYTSTQREGQGRQRLGAHRRAAPTAAPTTATAATAADGGPQGRDAGGAEEGGGSGCGGGGGGGEGALHQ